MKRLLVFILTMALFCTMSLTVNAAMTTLVPGHAKERNDTDHNGYSDAGVYVNGHYESVYAYDNLGKWYWDLGDGRIYGNVLSINDLDQDTLTVCEYNITYRADFGNDAYMDHGWIRQNIVCRGYDYPDGAGVYMYLIVSDTDPRYTGDSARAVWGTWEYHVLAESGGGNYFAKLGHAALQALKLAP